MNRHLLLGGSLILLLLAACHRHAAPVISPDGVAARPTDTIPFILTDHNNLALTAVLNGVDTVTLMLHTAADAVTLIRERAETLTSLHFGGADTVQSWGGESAASYSTGNRLRIGADEWTDLTIWENENSGPGTDGKCGPNLWAGRIIEIDFDHRQLLIHDELPEKVFGDDYLEMPLIKKNGFLFLEGSSTFGTDTVTVPFLLHTGYGGALLYDDETAARYNLGERLPIVSEQNLQDSYGNVLTVRKALLPHFRLGEAELEAVPVGFFSGAIGRQPMSVLGGAIVKRFNWVLDIERGRVFLRANGLAGAPFEG